MSPNEELPLRVVEDTTAIASPFESGDHARLIDREELASRLSVGVSTLDRLRAAGKIGPRAIRVGGAVRFRLAEVVAWIATPTPKGELNDIETWPAVWSAIQKKSGLTGH